MLPPDALDTTLGPTAYADAFNHSFDFITYGSFLSHWILSVQSHLIPIITQMTHHTHLQGRQQLNHGSETARGIERLSHTAQPSTGEAESLGQPLIGLHGFSPLPLPVCLPSAPFPILNSGHRKP